ncbi:hypothetical protein KGA66_15630 [Actinocrinis puniceicyclus]|uniref:GH26 domain-containing protein n=1 Tax=Actinocrinis puniceicyclus TaxID=977794 RepID=A0A8J7WNC2_9ACTN|nr:glycosyl hydrolase [Actinocrinis puniceicyclus]MBS2964488.1 hypothetical protein [Actinocrinis puniceicyclus]
MAQRERKTPGIHTGIHIRMRLAVILLAACLAVGSALAYGLGAFGTRPSARPATSANGSASPKATAASVVIPTKAQIMAGSGKYFGVAAANVPWQAAARAKIATSAGVSPNMAEYFVNWTKDFDPQPIVNAYAQGMLPVLSWQPFAGGTARHTSAHAPAYTLKSIIDGAHDAYITRFAASVKGVKWPVAIRFAHEMNGDWYPWSEGVNGNTAGQYAEAWRHVHDLFQKAGALNVIWVWSPNIVRSATTPMKRLYPGDRYVDWIGLSAYEVSERTTAQLLDPTLKQLRAFTAKPLLLTELGGQPGSNKAAWTADFLGWLARQPNVLGFVWFEYTYTQGAGTDWGFDADPATLSAFRKGIRTLTLARRLS